MRLSVERLKEILEYASEKQKPKIEATIKCNGNMSEAARLIGCKYESTVRKVIQRVNYIATAMNNPIDCFLEPQEPKVLFIDIETSPTKAFVWRMWKENVGANQVIDGSYIMTFAAKWLGSDEIIYHETRTEDDSSITKEMINLLDEAHFVVAHNADRFDVPRINASAILNGLTPPSPYKTIDTLRIAKKHFRFERNTLAYLAESLGCDAKLKHEKFHGFELWKECMNGNDEAWNEMMTYNIQDVHTLEQVYLKLRPWSKEHPNVAIMKESEEFLCSKCASNNLRQKGYTYSDVSKFKLFVCDDCGGYSRTRVSDYPRMIRSELLTTVR